MLPISLINLNKVNYGVCILLTCLLATQYSRW